MSFGLARDAFCVILYNQFHSLLTVRGSYIGLHVAWV